MGYTMWNNSYQSVWLGIYLDTCMLMGLTPYFPFI